MEQCQSPRVIKSKWPKLDIQHDLLQQPIYNSASKCKWVAT